MRYYSLDFFLIAPLQELLRATKPKGGSKGPSSSSSSSENVEKSSKFSNIFFYTYPLDM